MTAAERFGRWLSNAMRQADLDIDSQRGGGRSILADACGVSRSTASRWIEGASMPGPEHFKMIAKTVGVRTVDLLVGTGIMSAEDFPEGELPPASNLSVEEVADAWGIRPEDHELLRIMVEGLKKRGRRLTEPTE